MSRRVLKPAKIVTMAALLQIMFIDKSAAGDRATQGMILGMICGASDHNDQVSVAEEMMVAIFSGACWMPRKRTRKSLGRDLGFNK